MLVALVGGAVVLAPALAYLYVLFPRPPDDAPARSRDAVAR
jgi:hypothetical protein